jgi:flavin reductase (DIM6/NTAB) family NADH-FMN oxidoreductase RutF
VSAEPKQSVPIEQCLALFPGFPIVLVSTRSNVLTVGMVHYFRLQPLTLGVGVARARRSHELIRREREFVVNLATLELLEAVRVCGRLSGRDGDKFAAAGLTPRPGRMVRAAIIEECPANIECRVVEEIDLVERTWFLGEVVYVHRRADYDASEALFCGREFYRVAGRVVGPR